MTSAAWTADRIETLRKLWCEGHGAADIAVVLGGVSRNAVIGKIHRLGLSHMNRAVVVTHRKAAAAAQAAPQREVAPAPAPLARAPKKAPVAAPVAAPTPPLLPARPEPIPIVVCIARATLFTRPPQTCAAIIGDVGGQADPPVCGAPTLSPSIAWCAAHDERFCPGRPRRERNRLLTLAARKATS